MPISWGGDDQYLEKGKKMSKRNPIQSSTSSERGLHPRSVAGRRIFFSPEILVDETFFSLF